MDVHKENTAHMYKQTIEFNWVYQLIFPLLFTAAELSR